MSVLNSRWMREGLRIKQGQKLAYTPMTIDDYAATFDFGFGTAEGGSCVAVRLPAPLVAADDSHAPLPST
jgi:hypothetical protein